MRLLVGYSQGLPVYLTDKQLRTHLHGIGLSQQGKSKLIQFLCSQLIKLGKPFCLIDPHFTLYADLLNWLAYNHYSKPTVLFNPSYWKRIVGLNPFVSPYTDVARLMTKAERLVTSVLRIWGAENPNQYSNIERWLRCIFYTILEQQLSIGNLRFFIYWHYKDERERIVGRLKSQSIRDQLTDFYSVKDWKFRQDIQTTGNKLQKFIHPQMQRIMGLRDNNINLETIIEQRQVLLCNFQAAEDELIGQENTRVLGTLLLSEFWESFRKRSKPTEFYLIIDECHLFLGPDIQQILTESAKYGLHLCLFHQHEEQIRNIAGAMKNAQTKIIFSGEDSPKEQRNFTLRLPNHETVNVRVPEIPARHVSPDRLDAYVESLTRNFLTCDQVDERLNPPKTEDTPQGFGTWKAKPKTS